MYVSDFESDQYWRSYSSFSNENLGHFQIIFSGVKKLGKKKFEPSDFSKC